MGREASRVMLMAGLSGLYVVAVDGEVDGISVNEVLNALQEVERLGRTAVVYTSWNSWNTMIRPRNSGLCSGQGFRLWNASWDNNPDIDFIRLPFGGWTRATIIGEQWSGGIIKCGQSVDQNTFEEYVLLPQEEAAPLVPVAEPNKVLVWDGQY